MSALQDSARPARAAEQQPGRRHALFANDPDEVGQRRRVTSTTVARRTAELRRREPRSVGHHVGQARIGIPGARGQPRRHQADPARRADARFRTSSTSTSPPRPRSPGRWQSTTSPIRSRSCAARFRPPHGWAPSNRRSCACSTWRRSSRTASTTSRRSGLNPSSAPRLGPTRSPTARTGCARTTSRRTAACRPPEPPPGAAGRRRRRWPREAAPSATDPGRRPARHDGSARRWLMTIEPAAASRSDRRRHLPLVVVAAAVRAASWRGLNSLPLPGTAGRRAWFLRRFRPRCPMSPTCSRIRGSGSNDVTVGTVTKIETPGLARAGDHDAQRRRRPAGQRDGRSSARRACSARCTSSWPRRPTHRRKANCTTDR